jgi:hypothetical protein
MSVFAPQAISGWIPDTNTWTFSSVDGPTGVVTINADMTGLIGVGDRIQLTQTTVKYFIVTKAPTFATGSTTLTFYGGTDYTLANAAITSPSFSHSKVPFGFNPDPLKWTQSVTQTTDNSQASAVISTWYNIGSNSLSIPIGTWHVFYSASMSWSRSGGGTPAGGYSTLSTANNSESDTDFTSYARYDTGGGTTASMELTNQKFKHLTLTSKTSYFLNFKMDAVSSSTITLEGTKTVTTIKAICALL